MDWHTTGLDVQVNGQALPKAWGLSLAWALVEESTHASASAEVGFRDPSSELLTRAGVRLGSHLRVMARSGKKTYELFDGEITSCEARSSDGATFTVASAQDIAHRLKRGSRVAGYRQMSAGEIAAQLARQAGLRVGAVDRTHPVYEFLTQPAVSDWDFLTRLARENACDVFVREGALHFQALARAPQAPRSATPARQSPSVLEYGRNLIEVRTGGALRERLVGVSVRGCDCTRKTHAEADRPITATLSRTAPWRVDGQVMGCTSLTLSAAPRTTQDEVQLVAEGMTQGSSSGVSELHAVVRGEPQLRPRSAVSLRGLGAPYDGDWTVTSARHEYHPGTGFVTDLLVHEGADRPVMGGAGDAGTGRRRMHGVAPARVVDAKDPEQQGRVKLRFPWLSDDYVSDWARTVRLSGSRGGGIDVPDVDDEVLVGFELGSLDRPYVIGGLRNGVDKGPAQAVPIHDKAEGAGGHRLFDLNKGHRLELLDTARGRLSAVVTAQDDGLQVELDQRRGLITIRNDGAVEIEAKRHVRVGGEGITLDAGSGALNLHGAQVNMSGSEIALSGTDVEVSASDAVKVKGGALAELSAALVKIN
ncbi:VgrG-related protein [Streptomyces violascens]|uniref:VgrG-related protein n=1 Tax=Streptomyces violascens TaxID=67381 RepID=UPI00367723A5